ncbi:MAG TPA: hypothetical protein VK846_08665 [Candidatus Limnocylindria bacterium]|nr:hypothetical protein [Candidatus Limnocylindria bacterium]
MRESISKLSHAVSWLAIVATIIATVLWFAVVERKNGWEAMAFVIVVAPWIGGVAFCLGLIPSTILYFQRRGRRDLPSVFLSAISVVAIVAEAITLPHYCWVHDDNAA